MKITFQWPIVIKRGWKYKMKEHAKSGRALAAVREIKIGLDISIREAKDLWDNKYKSKYYKSI